MLEDGGRLVLAFVSPTKLDWTLRLALTLETALLPGQVEQVICGLRLIAKH